MKRAAMALIRDLFAQSSRCQRSDPRRRLSVERLESRRVFTLPATLNFAEGDLITYNGPTVDTVNDTVSFDAFIDFAGDVDSYSFAPQFNGSYTINVGDFGNTVDPEVAVYIASTGVRIGYNDDMSEFNDDAQLVVNLTADVRYVVAVADQPNTTAGNVSIIVTASFRTGSFLLTPDSFGEATASVLLDVPTDIDYYSITAPADATGNVSVSVTGSTLNQRLALFDSTGRLVQGPLTAINYSGVSPNEEYRIAVYSLGFATFGTLDLHIDFANQGAVVTNTLDNGSGSLRQAILDANAHPNASGVPDFIRFAIPGVGPFNIVLASALPVISDAVVIDGGSQLGTGVTPTVAIDGTALAGAIDGLTIQADGTLIRKLNIRKFSGDGIRVQASGVSLVGNTIGTDWLGVSNFANTGNGIHILGGVGNSIDSNVVSANGLSGIVISGETADNNMVTNNLVGVLLDGTAALPNNANGIVVIDGDSNELTGNLISGNKLAGVVLSGTAVLNKLSSNKIGTDRSGTVAVPNVGDGIVILAPRNQIGGNLPSLRNVISGNGKAGITITGTGASLNVVEGNYIGTNATGTAAVANAGDGVRVVNASRTRIGSSTDAAAGNVISGNLGSGVSFADAGSSGGIVLGNFIGTTADGMSALGNAGRGVLLNSNTTNIQIGSASGISRNVIAANGSSGITILSGSNNNRVSRNSIGVNIAGAARPNASSGITIQGSNNTVGGANAAFANIIAGNVIGIAISGAGATTNTIAFNTIGTDTAPNTARGVQVTNGASANTIGPNNSIRRNQTGILVDASSIRNRITQNTIAQNTGLGIDLLLSTGTTANDVGDADTGGNQLQNFPLLSSNPLLIGTDLEISFQSSSSPVHAAYPLTIEFFVSDGAGEGAKFLGSTIYTAANYASGVKTVSFGGTGVGLTVGSTKIVGTATDLNGNTSEFSAQRTLAAGFTALSSSAPQNKMVQDVNGDGSVNATDVLMVLSYISGSPAVSNDKPALSATRNIYVDIDADGSVSPQDALLVLRGIQLTAGNIQAVSAIDALFDKDIWVSKLVDLIAYNLPGVRNALLQSPWVKS